jgi:DNA-binding transcriptional LysR family regulator
MAKQSSFGRSLGDLESMALFARVIETRSFTAAAHALGTTTSSVSKRIARLEEQLGVQLIMRTTRSLSATEAGNVFYERCARILREVDEAEQAVTQLGGAPRGTLRITAPTTLGEAQLPLLLATFLERYPELRVEVDVTDRKVNLVEEGYDLGLRGMATTGMPDSSLVARRLATVRAIVCAAPSYLARRGTPRTLDDLVQHDCLHYNLVALHQEWSFPTPDGTRVVPVNVRMALNNSAALRSAAIAGAGLLRTPALAVGDALRAGALQTVLEEHAPVEFGLYAVYPMSKQALPKVRACVDFLSSELVPLLA